MQKQLLYGIKHPKGREERALASARIKRSPQNLRETLGNGPLGNAGESKTQNLPVLGSPATSAEKGHDLALRRKVLVRELKVLAGHAFHGNDARHVAGLAGRRSTREHVDAARH